MWGQTLSTHKALGHYQQFVWQDQHGLPQNGVLSILRTRDGYLWLGTIEGAARFDGVRFVVFDNNNTPGFKSNQILSLTEDRAGSLWLGAVSGGLTRYTDGRFRLYTKRDGLSSDFVRTLLADRAGNVWIGTRGGGLNLFRDERFTAYTTKDGLPSDQILTLAEDRNGSLWIGTSKGLARFEQGRFTVYTTRDGLPHDRVNALWPEHKETCGELWVGTGGGLCRLTRGRCIVDGGPVQALTHGSVTALYEDRQHNLWVGTAGNGLFLRRDGGFTQYTVRDGLPSDTVWRCTRTRKETSGSARWMAASVNCGRGASAFTRWRTACRAILRPPCLKTHRGASGWARTAGWAASKTGGSRPGRPGRVGLRTIPSPKIARVISGLAPEVS